MKLTKTQLIRYNNLNIKIGETFPFVLRPRKEKNSFTKYMKSYFSGETLFPLITVKVCQSRNADEFVLIPDDIKDRENFQTETLKIDELKFLLVKGVGIYKFSK